MKRKLQFQKAYLLLFLILTSCSTILPRTELVRSDSKSENTELLNSFCKEEIDRTPASVSACRDLFYGANASTDQISKSDVVFAKKLQADPLQSAEAKAYATTQGSESPINLSSRIQKFRNKFLGFFKISTVREPLTKSFEAFLRMRSEISAKAIERNNSYGQYDLVIVGTGVHGIIALHQALKQNPNLKVLLVDEGDTAGATFRYGKDVYSINSSNRASGEDTRPLPGEGNINELPGLPIQVSDLTAVKYPSANDLGASLVSGLYAAVREYPNVEVLFNTKAYAFVDKPSDQSMTESLVVKNASSAQDFRVDAQKVIVSTGLGDPILPPKVVESLKRKPALKESIKGKPPRVLTFEDMIRLIAESNDPMSFFKDKKVGIAGKGDSANVFIEFLLGYAPQAGYGRSSAQTGKPGKIFWIGQDKKTCEEFIADARSRYNAVSTGFKSSSANIEALIKPFKNKLADVEERGANKVDAELDGGEKISGLDYIVVATGFNQNVRELFQSVASGSKASTDSAFFERDFDTLEARTSVSPSPTKVGRKLKDREIYVLGTAANLFADENANKAPVKIVQNFVGIFINAPRVVAAVKSLTNDLQPKANPSMLQKVAVDQAGTQQRFSITNIQETRYISNQTIPYLEATFKEALSVCHAHSSDKIVLNLSLSRDGNLEVASETKADVTALVSLLVESRDFFSQVKELLKLVPDQSLLFTANPSGSSYDLAKAQVQTVRGQKQITNSNAIVKANRAIRLRGLELKENGSGPFVQKELSPRQETVRYKNLDLKNPKTYTDQAISVTIPAGKFKMGEPGQEVETTISKPYNLMATAFTQKFNLRLKRYLGEQENNLSQFQGENNPIERITPAEADSIAASLTKLSLSDNPRDQEFMLDLFPDHQQGRTYDLATEAQLERAYKLAKTEEGKTIDDLIQANDLETLKKYVNFASNGTVSVAKKLPLYLDGNPIYLQGNVFEITKDRWDGRSALPGGVDPLGTTGSYRVLRGGSWYNDAQYLRSGSRDFVDPVNRYGNVGFRLVTTGP